MSYDSASQRILDKVDGEQKRKLQEMLDDGWRVESYDGSDIEIVKGFHYKNIERSGRCYTI